MKDFLRNHRNTKARMILVCEMERQIIEKSNGESKTTYEHDKAYHIHILILKRQKLKFF